MTDKDRLLLHDALEKIMSDLRATRKSAETLDIARTRLGQGCPSLCPESCPPVPQAFNETNSDDDRLGSAMNIAEVARFLGCSVWTVRQKYIPQGLPHLRMSAAGKIVFFRSQIIDWILKQQKKGGNRP